MRPPKLENWCLADYVSKLNVIYLSKRDTEESEEVESKVIEPNECNHDDNLDKAELLLGDLTPSSEKINFTLPNGISFRERSNPRVIRYVRFSEKVDPEKAYRERLMLFFPWRDEQRDLLAGYDNFSGHYTAVKQYIETKRKEYEKNAEALQKAEEMVENDQDILAPRTEHSESVDVEEGVQQTIEFAFYDPDRPDSHRTYDIACDIGLYHTEDTTEVLAGRIPDDEYRQMIRSLNVKQHEFFTHVMKSIKTKDEPLHVFATGRAGVGKSVLLRALYQALHRYLCSTEGQNPEDCRILVCAYTGKAAYNVEGSTINHAFHIMPDRRCDSEYQKPSSSVLNTLRTKYMHLKVLMVDEVSMLGNRMFSFVNQRLQDIKGNKKPFGGIHVILMGDLFQLRPVMDHWIFKDLLYGYGPSASNLLVDLFTMHELTEIMRQKDDQAFATLLNRLREGLHTDADIQSLKQQTVQLHEEPSLLSVPHLYPTNPQVDDHNRILYDTSTSEKSEISAHDEVIGDFSAEVKEQIRQRIPDDTSKTAGLMSKLPVCVGLRYETTCNLKTEDGIVNGASCILKKIEYRITGSKVPSILWVQFDRATAGLQTRRERKQEYHEED